MWNGHVQNRRIIEFLIKNFYSPTLRWGTALTPSFFQNKKEGVSHILHLDDIGALQQYEE